MRPRTLRGRLTAAAAFAVVLAVAFLAVCARVLVAHQLNASLDGSLRRRATDVARLSVSAPALLTAPGALESPVAGRQLSVEVVDRNGRFIARSLTLGAKLLPQTNAASDALRRGRGGFTSVRLDNEPLRLFAAPLPDDGGPAAGGVVLVASSTREIDETLHRLGVLFVLSGVLAAGVGALAAAALTRRGLAPLARASSAAAEIARTGDASRRLPDPGAAGEVAELTDTLNRMLRALEAAGLRERRFLADASHELRTPVTSLAGNVDFVARHGANPEVLADLQLDAGRLQQLVGDLLALERETVGETPARPVRLDAIVAEAVAGRATTHVVATCPVTVLGEPDALRRALDNLLDNAEVHGPRGGEVSVSLTVSGATATLAVRDEGHGLDSSDSEHAFERFWRAPDAAGRPGSGLGLAIVRATAQRHGGAANADGSTVAITLPAVALGADVAAR
jgi:signal transduction histidine kinase